MFGNAFKATVDVGVDCGAVLLLLAVIAGGLASISREIAATTAPLQVTPTNSAPAAGKAWVVVQQGNGSGIKDTEKFTVGTEWRIDCAFTSS